MVKIERPGRPKIAIYEKKKNSLDQALRVKLMGIIDEQAPQYVDVFERLSNNGKFTKAETETLKAIAFFADETNFKDDQKLTNNKAPHFSVYKDPELKEKLKALFSNKCAYCESIFSHVSSADIEHFRPKAAINPFINENDDTLIYPGYYWLGAEWTNLLWSCPLCNRKTKQEVPNFVEPQPVGKKNRFPVKGEKRIRNHNQQLKDEEKNRLLLDPCLDNPEDHLEFQLDGLVMAKINEQGEESLKGKASIPAYALVRADLTHWRKMEVMNLNFLLLGLVSTIRTIIREEDPEIKAEHEKTFFDMKDFIADQFKPGAQYLAQKKVALNEFFKQQALEEIGLTKEDLLN